MIVSLPAGYSQDNPKKKGGPEVAPPPREKTVAPLPKAPTDLRKYEDVITKEAKSQDRRLRRASGRREILLRNPDIGV